MQRLKTNTPLDKILNGGIEKGSITNIYGPAGSGKTNIVLCALNQVLKNGKKAIYLDTESSFSSERFQQLSDGLSLEKINFQNIHSWEEQYKKIKNLENTVNEQIGMIVVDSLVNLYHLELDTDDYQKTNKKLAGQYAVLSKIARKKDIPVIVTSQVYGDQHDIKMIGSRIGKYWSKTLIELRKDHKPNQRTAIVRKHRSIPEEKSIKFEIKQNCLREIK